MKINKPTENNKLKRPVSGIDNINTRFNIGGQTNTFSISHQNGAEVMGYLRNQDFPQQKSIHTRGEVFLVAVPENQRGRGTGYLLVVDAINLIKINGGETVNLSATSQGGKRIVAKLIKNKVISEPIQIAALGKAEYRIMED